MSKGWVFGAPQIAVTGRRAVKELWKGEGILGIANRSHLGQYLFIFHDSYIHLNF
jgi:hypothetical protein